MLDKLKSNNKFAWPEGDYRSTYLKCKRLIVALSIRIWNNLTGSWKWVSYITALSHYNLEEIGCLAISKQLTPHLLYYLLLTMWQPKRRDAVKLVCIHRTRWIRLALDRSMDGTTINYIYELRVEKKRNYWPFNLIGNYCNY